MAGPWRAEHKDAPLAGSPGRSGALRPDRGLAVRLGSHLGEAARGTGANNRAARRFARAVSGVDLCSPVSARVTLGYVNRLANDKLILSAIKPLAGP